MAGRPEIVTDTESRQATRGRLNLRVLVVSLAMILIIFTGFYLAFYSSSPDRGPGPSPEPAAQLAPGPPAAPQP